MNDRLAAEVETTIRRLLSQASNQRLDVLEPDQPLRELGIDSLGCHAICVVLEAELGVSLDPDALWNILAHGLGKDLVASVIALGPAIQTDEDAS